MQTTKVIMLPSRTQSIGFAFFSFLIKSVKPANPKPEKTAKILPHHFSKDKSLYLKLLRKGFSKQIINSTFKKLESLEMPKNDPGSNLRRKNVHWKSGEVIFCKFWYVNLKFKFDKVRNILDHIR